MMMIMMVRETILGEGRHELGTAKASPPSGRLSSTSSFLFGMTPNTPPLPLAMLDRFFFDNQYKLPATTLNFVVLGCTKPKLYVLGILIAAVAVSVGEVICGSAGASPPTLPVKHLTY